jgi:hypothetical protein
LPSRWNCLFDAWTLDGRSPAHNRRRLYVLTAPAPQWKMSRRSPSHFPW